MSNYQTSLGISEIAHNKISIQTITAEGTGVVSIPHGMSSAPDYFYGFTIGYKLLVTPHSLGSNTVSLYVYNFSSTTTAATDLYWIGIIFS